MKKLLFIALFSIGFLTIGNAQELTYYVENQTRIDWNIDLTNEGQSAPVNLSLNPSDIEIGTISDFDFDLTIDAEDTTISPCNGSRTVSGTGINTVPLTCNPTYVINFSVTNPSPGVYHLHLEISG